MKKKKMVKLSSTSPIKSVAEISEVHSLLDLMKAIQIKEAQLKEKKKSEMIA
jgi:hypothetical protein